MASKATATRSAPKTPPKGVTAKAAAAAKNAKPAGKDDAEKDEAAPDQPLPLLDLSDAAVKKMIKAAKKRGYVTYEQLNAVMPSEEVTSEQVVRRVFEVVEVP